MKMNRAGNFLTLLAAQGFLAHQKAFGRNNGMPKAFLIHRGVRRKYVKS